MYYPPPPKPVITIQSDHRVLEGVILTATCSVGYPGYSYLWIAFGDTNYYSKVLTMLDQPCIVEHKAKEK